jgi:hypothetical protein
MRYKASEWLRLTTKERYLILFAISELQKKKMAQSAGNAMSR